jgi:hypothetical protein
VARGAVINRDARSPRFSSDLDIFHDAAASVAASAEVQAFGRKEGYGSSCFDLAKSLRDWSRPESRKKRHIARGSQAAKCIGGVLQN